MRKTKCLSEHLQKRGNGMIRIIGRNIQYSEDTGLACGAFDESAIDAELVLEDEGKRIFLYAQWTDQMPDCIRMEAT